MSQPVRLLVADAHAATHVALTHETREGELAILPDYARSFDETVAMCREAQPDILLLALELLPSSPISHILNLRQQFPNMDVVVLAEDEGDGCVQSFIQAGVVGYFQKSERVSFWLAGLWAVAAGAACFSREALVYQAMQEPTLNDIGQIHGLTERECHILVLMVQGLDARQIATETKTTHQTVRNYQSTIYKKLGVKGRSEILTIFQPEGDDEERTA